MKRANFPDRKALRRDGAEFRLRTALDEGEAAFLQSRLYRKTEGVKNNEKLFKRIYGIWLKNRTKDLEKISQRY